MTHPNTGGGDPRDASGADRASLDPAERSFDPAGEREPGVPGDSDESAHADARRRHAGSRSAGEAAERSVDVGGSPGAVPDDLRRERRPGQTKGG